MTSKNSDIEALLKEIEKRIAVSNRPPTIATHEAMMCMLNTIRELVRGCKSECICGYGECDVCEYVARAAAILGGGK